MSDNTILWILIGVFAVVLTIFVGLVWQVNGWYKNREAPIPVGSRPLRHSVKYAASSQVTATTSAPGTIKIDDSGQPVFMEDGTTLIPGCRERGGLYVLGVMQDVPNGKRVHYSSYNSKRMAIERSKELYPAEWDRILKPDPATVKRAVNDLYALEKELETPDGL